MIPRYSRPGMAAIWSEDNKYDTWLKVEILACEAWSKLGEVPEEAVEEIRSRARIDAARIAEIESRVRHDVIAFVTQVAESVGEAGKWVHFGMTSYDVVDTALSYLMVRAADIILDDLEALRKVVADQAHRHKETPMIGRTHGVHAEPITFGMKMALWYAELGRCIERVQRAREVAGYGRIAGAVGTFAHVDPFVERYVCEKMGLMPAPVSTQVLQRDRHAEYVLQMALVASSLEKFATEIRHLQRTEVLEAEEPFREGQKGSSAMPHKRNPITCEQICGLSRVMRGNAMAALENINLWHERDISNSSVERIILPDTTILLDYMIAKFTGIVKDLRVYPTKMMANLELTGGLVFSQRVMLTLVEKGMPRDKAYTLVQGLAMKAWEEGLNFKSLVSNNPGITAVLSEAELEDAFDYRRQLGRIGEIFDRVGL
ncbi:MAG: adenylosuccinate lyase [Firmicutes bacterium]|nr:adenylosuccinate lyase [Bacillota bacterium]